MSFIRQQSTYVESSRDKMSKLCGAVGRTDRRNVLRGGSIFLLLAVGKEWWRLKPRPLLNLNDSTLNRERNCMRCINHDVQVHPPAPTRIYKSPSSSYSGCQFYTKVFLFRRQLPLSLCLLLLLASPSPGPRTWYRREQRLRNLVLLLRSCSGCCWDPAWEHLHATARSRTTTLTTNERLLRLQRVCTAIICLHRLCTTTSI
jgi:hypothetical protein